MAPLPQGSKAQQIEQEILAYIHKHLKPGERLPSQRELEDLFKSSRTTVTSALKVLASQGVLVSKRGSGHYVARLTPQTPGPKKTAAFLYRKEETQDKKISSVDYLLPHYLTGLQTSGEEVLIETLPFSGTDPLSAYPLGYLSQFGAFVVLGALPEKTIKNLLGLQGSVLILGTRLSDPIPAGVSVITTDRKAAAQALLTELKNQGHTEAGIILYKTDHHHIEDVFEEVFEKELPAQHKCCIQTTSGVREFRKIFEFLSTPLSFSAVICIDEFITQFTVHRALAMGLEIPKDLSVVSLNHAKGITDFSPLTITGVDNLEKAEALGKKAGALLKTWATNKPLRPEVHLVPFALTQGNSIGPKP